MANTVLFLSSLCFSLSHFLTICWYQPPLIFSMMAFLVCVSSLSNHGLTSKIAQYSDRIYSPIYVSYNIINAYHVVEDNLYFIFIFLIAFTGSLCVLHSMFVKQNNIVHMYSHLVIMVLHTLICIEYN